jgi:hypothetical protein
MINASEYRAMAAEHHRLAGMCRSPESREQHFRLEQEFLALAEARRRLFTTKSVVPKPALFRTRAPSDFSPHALSLVLPKLKSQRTCPSAGIA